MKNRTRRQVTYKNDSFDFFFLLLELSPLLVFEFDFLSLLCNTNTLWNILMMLGTNAEHDETTLAEFAGTFVFMPPPFSMGRGSM